MNRLLLRTFPLVLLIGGILWGLVHFCLAYGRDGETWATARVNGDLYAAGQLRRGEVEDRHGEPLLSFTETGRTYPAEETLRRATLHILGDQAGNIAGGVQRRYRRELTNWSPLWGIARPVPLRLSVDADLQKAAYTAMAGRAGVCAVVNYRTGALLCLVISPAFDPEHPDNLPPGAYLDRFLSAAYTPGSVFKLVTVIAALENLEDVLTRSFTCTGSRLFDGQAVTCPTPHGDMKLEDAFAKSCNCVFGALAQELGAETMHRTAQSLGLLTAPVLDGTEGTAGRYDAAFSTAVELAWSGSGQHTDLVTPAALLRLVSAVASGGAARDFTLLAHKETGETPLLKPETAQKLREMMTYNVLLTYGQENFPGLPLGAKSGTAEVGGGQRPHAWFTGFLAEEAHPYAFVTLVEHGGGGSKVAGAVANAVLQQAVQK